MKKILVVLAILAFAIFPHQYAFSATEGVGSNPIKIINPIKGGNSNLISFVTLILNNVIMPIAAVAVTLYIIWAGFLYVTAQGNPAKIQEAHNNLLWALIGAGVLLGAAAISRVVQSTVQSLTN